MKSNETKKNGTNAFEKFATNAAHAAGSTYAFSIAFLIVVVWAICGPIFDFSETWQLVINTGTTIITFLMVFLIQKAQNKDSLAIQLKLNELVASSEYSSNRLVDIENMTEDEMIIVQKYYRSLSELSKKDVSLKASHSIEEAEDSHEEKTRKIHKKTPEAKIPKKTKTTKTAPPKKTPVKK
jgi:low affinity Fe/Cu permease